MPLCRIQSTTILIGCSVAASACGKERWTVKVLTDPDHGKIQGAKKPAQRTVTVLRNIAAPSQAQLRQADDSRFAPTETRVVTVSGLLLRYHFEKDGDFHLVVADPTNLARTMIAEIPDPQCMADQKFAAVARDMRNRLMSAFGSPKSHPVTLSQPTPIRVRGVPFFDLKHPTPQDGVAPNGIEIHPVLGLDLGR